MCYSRTATPPRVKPRACQSAPLAVRTKRAREQCYAFKATAKDFVVCLVFHAFLAFVASRTFLRTLPPTHLRAAFNRVSGYIMTAGSSIVYRNAFSHSLDDRFSFFVGKLASQISISRQIDCDRVRFNSLGTC